MDTVPHANYFEKYGMNWTDLIHKPIEDKEFDLISCYACYHSRITKISMVNELSSRVKKVYRCSHSCGWKVVLKRPGKQSFWHLTAAPPPHVNCEGTFKIASITNLRHHPLFSELMKSKPDATFDDIVKKMASADSPVFLSKTSVSKARTSWKDEQKAKEGTKEIGKTASRGSLAACFPNSDSGAVVIGPSLGSPISGTTSNPLLDQQAAFLNGLSKVERFEFFGPAVSTERRAELWKAQAELGQDLVDQFSWATPDATAIRILKEFSPLVEIGCGKNAYWCKTLKRAGVDILGYDTIDFGQASDKQSKKKRKFSEGKITRPSYLKFGGPEVLSSSEMKDSSRTLFLCHPDDEDGDDDEENKTTGSNDSPKSLGYRCLEHFSGQHVVHVGELFVDANPSVDRSPWGQSSSREFQERLASEFHCVLKAELPNWLHTRDTISVWKRSIVSTVDLADGESGGDVAKYRHIPVAERLPTCLAASYLAHLLPTANGARSVAPRQRRKGPRTGVATPTKRAKMSTNSNGSSAIREPVGEKRAINPSTDVGVAISQEVVTGKVEATAMV